MWLALLLNPAHATELVFTLTTGEGVAETWSKDHKEAETKRFGPVLGKKKRRVRYDVTVMPSVFDPLENAFQTQVSICRYWSRGSERDRDCVEDLLMIPSKSEGQTSLGGKVKASDKFEVLLRTAYAGPPPSAVGLPGDPQPEVEMPEAEGAEEESPVEEKPAKDEMTSALENIASDIVSGLEDEEPETAEEAEDSEE
ncbi:MAG: hypothetical protein KTR31_24540 [Myxococcales bacterium]|nr:hypothetical protein [Myxococcales bacterium]